MIVKRCTTCGEAKTIEYFSPDKRSKGGFKSKCKPCRAEYNAQWYRDNPEKYQRHVEYVREYNRRKRAERKAACA